MIEPLHTWLLDPQLRRWQVECRVYRRIADSHDYVKSMGISPKYIKRGYRSIMLYASRARRGQHVVCHLVFGLDTVGPRTIIHELQHLALYLFRMAGKKLPVTVGDLAGDCRAEEFLCDLISKLAVLFMWHWRKAVDDVVGEKYPTV